MKPIPVLAVHDPGKDVDDEFALITLVGLERLGLIRLIGVIANLEPALERARLAKGTLRTLGAGHVPVYVGSDCIRVGAYHAHETSVPYLADANDILPFTDIIDLLQAQDDPITLLCCAALTDIVKLCVNHPTLLPMYVNTVVLMGGVDVTDTMHGLPNLTKDGLLRAAIGTGGAMNNTFDAPAAAYLHQYLQERQIPMVVLTRFAAYAAQMPFSMFGDMSETGHPIGRAFMSRIHPWINSFWRSVHAPVGSPERGPLSPDRDRHWFARTFCENIDPNIAPIDDIWPHVRNYQVYDALAALAVVPELRGRFFADVAVGGGGSTFHSIIGPSQRSHGVRSEKALRKYLTELILSTLNATRHLR